ncbi:1-deoxy-D-xylulose-5-phosphate synthase [Ruminococcaceae bacterium OttesenSCG-928-I18]|nr:1-deoxy-D-xylulose-5-phosphate synthase [Ruminococcaceae bacterium OttesenSCG-928-I18]
MNTRLLQKIKEPNDIKTLDYRELEQLAQEIREFLIENVSNTGGHLSSNLGVVETTLALHRCFSSPQDVLLFDVGHQCYTHKILTGRKDRFSTLRQEGGISGFPCPVESEHDKLRAGHASNSISAAVGIARAKKIKREPGYVIALIGDGAFTGGLAYEGINNTGGLDNLIVVLNDNTMSISKNVGALAHYFTRLRTSPQYYKAKSDVKSVLDNTPVIGRGVSRGIHSAKSMFKRTIYKNTMFEEMGFLYVGPQDGHNLPELCNLFENAKEAEKPIMIHLETKKGKGFTPAENNPGAFHGVPSFNARKVRDPDISPKNSFSTVFGEKLAELAGQYPQLCAITAAMKYGTGLQYIKKDYPSRFFDVGLAEEHAVSFAAGLAAEGMLPVVAIYSTFLQRAYDQIIHDVMLAHADVLFAIDRAGLVPGDGETHQGIYDAAFLSQQQGLFLVSPANYSELRHWLKTLVSAHKGPRAIRYARGTEPPLLAEKECTGQPFDLLVQHPGAKTALLSYGSETEELLKAEEKQRERHGAELDVVQMIQLNPLPQALLQQLSGYETLLFAEEGIRQGGIGEHLLAALYKQGFRGRFEHLAVPETGIDHASVPQLRKQLGLDVDAILCTLDKAP